MSGTSAPAAAAAGGEKPHAVCVPFPAQGHVTPMMKLAKILHHRGFHVTFVNSEYNHRRLVRSRGAAAVAGLPGFRFATIPDGLPESDADATQDPAALCYSTMTTCLPHLRALLADLNRSAPPVTCVVADGCLTFAVDAAADLGVPCALLWTASACGALAYHYYRTFIDKGIIPLKDAEQLTNGFLDTPMDWVPGMSKHMRLRDYPSFLRTTDPNDRMLEYALHEMEHCKGANAIIYNTFDELDQPALDALRAGFTPSAYTVGPISLLAERLVPAGGPLDALGSSLWKEDTACLEWLDGREARSVVYVNYGSITVMTNQQLLEFAWGLANSGYAFLWVIRPDLVSGDAAVLPPEFTEATRGRGMLASWCPQEDVLRHDAVGVFLTHSGWNSTLESLSGGVPMLTWPFFAEQLTNSLYKCMEWGVAMEVGGDVRRDVVEGRIREAMAGEKGKEMRERAAEWKEATARTTRPGGSSFVNMERLINDVLLLKSS
ncbi:unnamed protein product [Urochloa decumbens]|uniref:Glycosyltransferase n=1 Tax=Urochloa decumbens TaxID=240449 RepID=A0ABC9CHP3_9POAL